MRLACIYICLGFACLRSDLVTAQDNIRLITDDIRGESLDKVLRNWQKEYEINFAYDSEVLRNVIVSGQFKETPLDSALTILISDKDLTFRKIGKTIVVFSKIKSPVVEPTKKDFVWRGRVMDKESGEPLPFATLHVAGTGSGTTSAADGRFVFTSVPSDTSTVIVNYVGYDDYHFKLSPALALQEGKIELRMRRGLLPQAIIYGENLSLIQSHDIPGMQVISLSDLSFIASPGEPDVLRTAQLLPGIDATGESGNGLNIRGSDADQSLVQMDGYTIYHFDHFFGIFSAFNPSTIKSLSVQKGVLKANQGGRTGGMVELIARDGNRNKTSAEVNVGLVTGSIVLEGPVDKKNGSTFMIGFRRAYTDLIPGPTYRILFNNLYNSTITDVSQEEIDVFNSPVEPDFSFYDLTSKLTLRLSPKHTVKVGFYNGKDDLSMIQNDTLADGRFIVNYADESNWGNTGASIKWNYQVNESVTSESSLSYSLFKSESFSTDSTFDTLVEISDVINRFEKNSVEDITFKTGISKNQGTHTMEYGLSFTRLSLTHTRNLISDEGGTVTEDNPQGSLFSIYVQDEWKPTEKLTILPGARITYYDVNNTIQPEPRLNVMYRVNPLLLLKIGGGRATQYIHRVKVQSLYLSDADYWSLSDDVVLPLLSTDQVLGGFRVNKKNWSVDVESWYKWNHGSFENVTPYFAISGGLDSLQIVTGDGEAFGADVLFQKDFRKHHLWIGYGFLKATNRFTEFPGQDIPESYEQRHELKIGYQLKLERWDFSLAWFYGSGKPYTPLLGAYNLELINGDTQLMPVYGELNSARLPGYQRLDASAAYLFKIRNTQCKLAFSVFNLYDHTNIKDRQYYAIPSDPNDPGKFVIGTNDVSLLGITPSVFISVKW